MTDDLADKTPGQRIRYYRERAGMSRTILAGLVGRSAEWVKAVEKGRLLPPRLPMLLRLAEVLGVTDLADLTGSQSLDIHAFSRGRLPGLPAIRSAVHRYPVKPPSGPTYPLRVLSARVMSAWRTWHTASDRRATVGALLPALLTDCQDAVAVHGGAERREAHAVLADAYHLAQHAVVNAAEPELLWLTADRAMAAAREADQPLALAGGAWTVGMVLRGSGRMEESLALVTDASALLEPRLAEAPPDWLGMWGALQLHAAVTAARAGRDGVAWGFWDRAGEAARSLPDGYMHPWTAFGAANVNLHAVSLTVDLWKSRDALQRAESIDPESIPSRERRGRFFVELARGHHTSGDRIASTRLLQHAASQGIDAVRWSPAARTIIDDLLAKPPVGARADVRDLAQKLGMAI